MVWRVQRFFKWLESKVYKMHVRVFLSKFRSYTQCPTCNGDRLQEEARLEMAGPYPTRTVPQKRL